MLNCSRFYICRGLHLGRLGAQFACPCAARAFAHSRQELPDFKAKLLGTAEEDDAEIKAHQDWLRSAMRCFLGADLADDGPEKEKKIRLASFWHLQSLDNVLRHCCGHGLAYYQALARCWSRQSSNIKCINEKYQDGASTHAHL